MKDLKIEIRGTQDRFACPACSDPVPKAIGKLENIEGLIPLADPGYLFHCGACGLFFPRPYASDAALKRAYSELEPDTWPTTARQDFAIATQIIGRWGGVRNALEVECFRGDFLAMLPDHIRRYRIEPSLEIQTIAASCPQSSNNRGRNDRSHTC